MRDKAPSAPGSGQKLGYRCECSAQPPWGTGWGRGAADRGHIALEPASNLCWLLGSPERSEGRQNFPEASTGTVATEA